MSYQVKWIHSGMRGAPVLSGTAGALIAAIDAFLLTGFGQVTPLSVSVSGGVATATLNVGESFQQHCVVLVQGATDAALNGEARVLTATSSGITWATSAADGPASGAITIKVAPVGQWEKVFSATNVAVYRSTDVTGARFYYRMDDTGTVSARLRGFVSMTDVDTGDGPFPTDAQVSGGMHLIKSSVASAAAAPYILAADSRALLLAISPRVPSNSGHLSSPVRGFGDPKPLNPAGDAWAAFVSGATDSSSTAVTAVNGALDSNNSGLYLARDASGLGGAVVVGTLPYVGGTSVSGGDQTLGRFPSSVTGQLMVSGRFLYQNNSATDRPPRADVPGVLHVPQTNVLGLVNRLDFLDGSGVHAGRKLLALASNATSLNTAPTGISLLDITGPWR